MKTRKCNFVKIVGGSKFMISRRMSLC